MKTLLGLTVIAVGLMATGCNKQMDDFVSGVKRIQPSLENVIPFEDDGVNYVRLSVAEEKVSSASYTGQVVIGAPVDQIQNANVSASIVVNRTSVE
ncbi:MAG: hypothetical protein KF681_17035 [Bdellovibrionaceae bacterium]|nr:hypothetical protein [Pseudobdellovibrionaceae bacterium]